MLLPLGPESFACGAVRFIDKHPITDDPRIVVPMRIGQGETEVVFAIVDTASPWFVLAPDVADALKVDRSAGEYRDRKTEPLLTAYGRFGGWLCRVPVTFLADEGTGIEFETTVFIPEEGWPSDLNFAGLENFLFRIRFAVDPERAKAGLIFEGLA